MNNDDAKLKLFSEQISSRREEKGRKGKGREGAGREGTGREGDVIARANCTCVLGSGTVDVRARVPLNR